MEESRRQFLTRAACLSLAAGGVVPLVGAALRAAGSSEAGQSSLPRDGEDATPAGTRWGLVIDLAKCRQEEVRAACIEACHRRHNVPQIPSAKEEVKWIWSEKYEDVFADQVHLRMADTWKETPVLVLCNHCTHPACTKVCPTEATWKRPSDGIVMMDMHRCIGCRYCMAACPYGARSFNWRDPRPFIKSIDPHYPTRTKGVVEKCNFCEERLRDGQEPACVEAARGVPGGQDALTFGDLADPESAVSRLLRAKYTICRRPSLGTGPSVFYIV